MEVKVFNTEGKETGKLTLSKEVFGIEPNEHAMWLDVRLLQANQRQGTAKVKERGEVSGSTKKPYKQKGTGNARAGHKRSPLWRHGGTIFGPRPRAYGFKLNKKLRRLARRSALSTKASAGSLLILDSLQFEEPKTKAFVEVLSNLKLEGKKVLLVTNGNDENVYRSSRNVQKVHVSNAANLNTLDILHADNIVLLQDAVETITTNLTKA